MNTTRRPATHITAQECEALGDWVLAGTAIVGAVCGAVAGVLLTPALVGIPGEVFGTIGTIFGSLTGAVLGSFVLRPISAILFTPAPHATAAAATHATADADSGHGLALDA